MTHTLLPHPLLDRALTAGVPVYLLEISADGSLVRDHINGWLGEPAGSHYRAYAELLRDSQTCYRVLATKDPDQSYLLTNYPLPGCLVQVLDAEDRGTAYQFTGNSLELRVRYLNSPLHAGTVVYGVPDRAFTHAGCRIMFADGPDAGKSLLYTSVQPVDPAYVNPWEEVLGEIIRRDAAEHVYHNVGYVLPLARHRTTGRVVFAHGPYAGKALKDTCYCLPADEAQAQIFARKVLRPYQLQCSTAVTELLAGANESCTNHVKQFADDYWWTRDFHLLAAAPSNYWAVDPQDYKRVTFLPQGKVAGVLEKGQDPWDCPARQSTTWAKLIKGFLNDAICTATAMERVSTHLVAMASQLFGPEEERPELLIVEGADVVKYYNYTHYMPGGDLNGSCMRSCEAARFDLYAQNPAQVKLLIAKDRQVDKIYGRALLWYAPDGSRYVDRRYATSPVEETRLLRFAEQAGYVNLWGGHHTPKSGVQIPLPNWLFLRYPYMDSMSQLDPRTGVLSSVHVAGQSWSSVKNTSGGRTATDGEVKCAQSHVLAPKEIMEQTASGDYAFAQYVKLLRSGKKELENRCVEDQLEGGLISKVESVSAFLPMEPGVVGFGKITSKGNPGIAYISAHQQHYVKESLVLSPLDGGYILKKDAVQQPDGGWCLPQTVARYQAMRNRKKVNKARRVTTLAPVEQLVNAAAEFAVAA